MGWLDEPIFKSASRRKRKSWLDEPIFKSAPRRQRQSRPAQPSAQTKKKPVRSKQPRTPTGLIADSTGSFLSIVPTSVENWRNIVLFGKNSACYKFALAKSLLELAPEGREVITLPELAPSFSKHVCEHLVKVDRQTTSTSSKFLDACRYYNAGRINKQELIDATVLHAFNDVVRRFHNVPDGPVSTPFYIDETSKSAKGLRLTDEVFMLAGSTEAVSLNSEVEARWNLVEEAWEQGGNRKQTIVLYDAQRELLVPALTGRRRPIAEFRPAFNGYQKGHCFYCDRPISVVSGTGTHRSDVDHFLPHNLMARGLPYDLDQVWNLVLSCERCNRGEGGKGPKIPHRAYLSWLSHRNEWLISSHHPLRKTVMDVTGVKALQREKFLNRAYDRAHECNGTSDTDVWVAPDENGWKS